jgi:hypothetical protein
MAAQPKLGLKQQKKTAVPKLQEWHGRCIFKILFYNHFTSGKS